MREWVKTLVGSGSRPIGGNSGESRAGARWRWSAWFCGVIALAALSLALVGNVGAARDAQERAQWWRTHTLDVLIDAERLDTALNKSLRGERGYLVTGRAGALATYERELSDYRAIARRLRWLTRDNASQQRRLADLDRRVLAFAGVSAPVVERMREGETGQALPAVRVGREREALESASSVLDAIKAEERRLLSIREARNNAAAARIGRDGRVMRGLAGLLLLLVAGTTATMLRARETALRAARTARESERRYRLLADNATDVVLRTDEGGFVLYASPSCNDLSGHHPEELIGRHCSELIHPEDGRAVHAAHTALVSGHESAVTVEYRLRHKRGDWCWLESHMRAWRAPGDDSGGVISAIRDISRRKELETELVAARDKAEGAARVKATFLANMSHEIRTPMNGVLGFTELVLSGNLKPDQRRHVELIAESGRSMMRLLNDILDASKIESGKMRIAAEPVDLRHVLRRCTDLMAPTAGAKKVAISAAIDPAVPPRIVGDTLRLRQVMLNLIGNAVKFTEHGSITVKASVEHGDVRIDVTDTGIGIPAERLGVIFDQFAQADESTAKLYGGTGLGLSISGELARLMGGSIAAASVVGAGTTFTVRLPLREAEIATAPTETDDASPPAGSTARKPRVLIAEDHDINQELIVAMAARAGMEPALASNGAEAIAMIEEAEREGRPFRLVLMDMQMPEVDGLEATRRLRATGRLAEALPIVALTANAYAEDVHACLAVGMQAHLAKPVRVRDLTALLARFVGPNADATVPARPAVSPRLLERYLARKAETLHLLEQIAALDRPDEQAMAQAADLLHKLAGVAGMFGEVELGEHAKALEDGFLACSEHDRAARARAAVTTFRQAA